MNLSRWPRNLLPISVETIVGPDGTVYPVLPKDELERRQAAYFQFRYAALTPEDKARVDAAPNGSALIAPGETCTLSGDAHFGFVLIPQGPPDKWLIHKNFRARVEVLDFYDLKEIYR